MSSVDASRAALADTTDAVLNSLNADGAPLSASSSSAAAPPLPTVAHRLQLASPHKTRRAQWDKSRLSMTRPVFLQDDGQNEKQHDANDSSGSRRSHTLSSVSALLASQLRSQPAAEPETSSARGQSAASATTSAVPARLLPPPHPPASVHSTPASAAPLRPSTTSAASRRQSASLNSTYSHSQPAITRSSSPSPTPLTASPSLSSSSSFTTDRNVQCRPPVPLSTTVQSSSSSSCASSACAGAFLSTSVVTSGSGSASTAAMLLGAAAALVRNAKRSAGSSIKRETAQHKRRKSTETAAAAADVSGDATPQLQAAESEDNGPDACSRAAAVKRAGRQSLSSSSGSSSSSARSRRQSQSISRPQSPSLRPLRISSSHSRPLQSSSSTQTSPTAACPSPSTVSSLRSQLSALEAQLSTITQQQAATRSSLFQQTLACEEERKGRREAEEERDGLKAALGLSEGEVQRLHSVLLRQEGELREAESVRRRLHAYVEEMKGSVRVMVRVRPLLPRELPATAGAGDVFAFLSQGEKVQMLEVRGKEERSVDGSAVTRRRQSFLFDRIFPPSASQEAVFDSVQPLVVSVLDGYSALVFAYGSSGSGKTYTMGGPDISDRLAGADNSSSSSSGSAGSQQPGSAHSRSVTGFSSPSHSFYGDRGVMQRSVELLFTEMSRRRERTGWAYTVSVSILELYCDTIHDLLVERDCRPHEIRQQLRPLAAQPITGDCSQAHSRVDITVTNLHRVDVLQAAELYSLLDRAKAARRVGSTDCNERSSRSHLVVRLQVAGSGQAGERSEGSLHLIDLAGSERLKQSRAEGARLKETTAINRSLSALADVIAALGRGDAAHVPYRNSKLTHLLQPFLACESKVLMLVHLSPHDDHLSESLCSLRFAQTVAGVGGKKK